ncbi:hypothetical protein V5799_011336 [Amblyomma americanum]|uniref:DDE Tnp4 domain-containing protein n=1 Tax=Amblyomma americanum TaxID=6943 RepID=A0AAQ4EHI6_AMBAM
MAEYSVLNDPLLLGSLSWTEIEDLFLCNLLSADTMDGESEHGDSDVMNASDRKFRQRFRFEKMGIRDLADALKVPLEVTSAEGAIVSGDEALCMTVRRLAFPNGLCDLEHIFGRPASVTTSVVAKAVAHVEQHFGHLLADLTNHKWLNAASLEQFSAAVHARRAPLKNCWGFVDATARRILQAPTGQQSGRMSEHVQKYQAVMCANGIVCQLDGPFSARRHDGGKWLD